MSRAPGNPYVERIDENPRIPIEAAATLALVYEQRTANLIAALESSTFRGKALMIGEDHEIAFHIRQRLGLEIV